MGMKTTTFYDSGAARRRRLVYALSAIIVIGCGIAVYLLSGDERQGPEPTVAC